MRRSIIECFVLLMIGFGILVAQEKVNLDTPIDPDPRLASEVELAYLMLHRLDGFIEIGLVDPGGSAIIKRVRYTDDESSTVATDLMKALNTADLSTNSLHRRIFNRLIADGHLDGTVTGTPEARLLEESGEELVIGSPIFRADLDWKLEGGHLIWESKQLGVKVKLKPWGTDDTDELRLVPNAIDYDDTTFNIATPAN